MIATGLTFLFGVLVTTLLAILVAPLVWRKAQSLAKRDYVATIPASANEIRAEFDRVRAEAALSVRRQEILAAKANEKAARSQAELGRGTVENVELLKRARGLAATVEQQDAELARLTAAHAETSEKNADLAAKLEAARHEATLTTEELAALVTRFQDLGEIAEERKIQLIAADAKLDRFADQGRTAERAEREAQATIARLRDEVAAGARAQAQAQEKATAASLAEKLDGLVAALADREEEIAALKARLPGAPLAAPSGSASANESPGDSPALPGSGGPRLRAALAQRQAAGDTPAATPAEISEAISDLAARVIQLTAVAEGPDSPLAPLLKTPHASGRTGAMTLAERVAMLADRESGTATGSPQATPTRPA